MMSPLALLQEGEIAEIIDPNENGSFTQPRGRHQHRHAGCCQSTPCCSGAKHRHGRELFSAPHHDHLHDMGLRPGKKVEMITNSGNGPLVLRVDECRIAMGRGAAMKIYIRRNTP